MRKFLLFTMILLGTAAYAQEGVVINGIRWAERNVGAPGKFVENIEDAGLFYQFNRRVGWNEMGSSPKGVSWSVDEYGVDKWEAFNDPCPKGWRVPYLEELAALGNPIKVETRAVKDGRNFIDKVTNATIFLPTMNFHWYDNKVQIQSGRYGGYWSSRSAGSSQAYIMRIYSNGVQPADVTMPYEAFNIRCVSIESAGSEREKKITAPGRPNSF